MWRFERCAFSSVACWVHEQYSKNGLWTCQLITVYLMVLSPLLPSSELKLGQ